MAPLATHPPQRRRPRRAGRRPPIEPTRSRVSTRGCRRSQTLRRRDTPASGQAAPGRDGRARRGRGLSSLTADQPGIARCPRSQKSLRGRTKLDKAAPRQLPRAARRPSHLAMAAPAVPAGPDFSVLERQLFKITSQIEALQRPSGIEQSIAAFRQRTGGNSSGHYRGDAAPRDRSRSRTKSARWPAASTIPARAASTARRWPGIERALSEIREVLRSLTPAEQLAGYDEAIRNLAPKLDLNFTLQRRPLDDPSARRRHRRASLHRLQCRLQRRIGAAQRRRAPVVVQGRPACQFESHVIRSRFSNNGSPH